MKTKLSKLPLGQEAVIKKINIAEPTKERLHSFGFIEKVEICPIKELPLGGLRIYRLMNTSVALRNEIANQIYIKKQFK